MTYSIFESGQFLWGHKGRKEQCKIMTGSGLVLGIVITALVGLIVALPSPVVEAELLEESVNWVLHSWSRQSHSSLFLRNPERRG